MSKVVAGPLPKWKAMKNEGQWARICPAPAGSWGASGAMGCPEEYAYQSFSERYPNPVRRSDGALSNAEAAKASGRCVTNSRSV